MFGQSILTIAGVWIGVVIVGFGLIFWWLMRRLVLQRPLGEYRDWHMTIEHSSKPFSPGEYWAAAMAELEANSELLREWNSHDALGGRVSREYRLDDSTVLLELDRWNGFTISGEVHLAEPIAKRIMARLEHVS
jgi:hypothetical protein